MGYRTLILFENCAIQIFEVLGVFPHRGCPSWTRAPLSCHREGVSKRGSSIMTLTGLLLFSAAYATAVFSPGPGVAALVARVLARGLRGAPAFIAGFLIGDLVWFTVAATGLALLAQTFAMVFLAVKYAGAAYLLYLAWRLW